MRVGGHAGAAAIYAEAHSYAEAHNYTEVHDYTEVHNYGHAGAAAIAALLASPNSALSTLVLCQNQETRDPKP